ncbi:hypothetical protein COS55_03355, partial [Candidatus Shapirobacteria bacterium CG03_land_8_20_14_0_80_40_19]
MEKFHKFFRPLNIFLITIIGLLIVNKFNFQPFSGWRVEYNTILVEYLKVFLTLPVVILIIVVMFCIKFSSAIDFFIRNLKLKYKDLEATSQQVKDFQPDSSPNHDLENEIIKLSKQDVQEIASGIEN